MKSHFGKYNWMLNIIQPISIYYIWEIVDKIIQFVYKYYKLCIRQTIGMFINWWFNIIFNKSCLISTFTHQVATPFKKLFSFLGFPSAWIFQACSLHVSFFRVFQFPITNRSTTTTIRIKHLLRVRSEWMRVNFILWKSLIIETHCG